MTIYVVCRAETGQKTGDWAVKRENGPYLSSHRLKTSAVEKARSVAKGGEGVVIQGKNGKFM